jgi:hypothetical protein
MWAWVGGWAIWGSGVGRAHACCGCALRRPGVASQPGWKERNEREAAASSAPVVAGVGVAEAALGDAQPQRRLPALKAEPRRAPSPRLLPLVAPPRRLAQPRANAATHPLGLQCRKGWGKAQPAEGACGGWLQPLPLLPAPSPQPCNPSAAHVVRCPWIICDAVEGDKLALRRLAERHGTEPSAADELQGLSSRADAAEAAD